MARETFDELATREGTIEINGEIMAFCAPAHHGGEDHYTQYVVTRQAYEAGSSHSHTLYYPIINLEADDEADVCDWDSYYFDHPHCCR